MSSWFFRWVRRLGGWLALPFFWWSNALPGQQFLFPTDNLALLDSAGAERFYMGTAGKPWTNGMFGCVRSGGWQMHEGIDIRCLSRDQRGEPTDRVMACANGTVAYLNRRASLSNYGLYLLLRHEVEGLEVYSLYAHLREIRPDLIVGRTVRAGESIGTLGRTANTREVIAKERAHLHFELNLFINDRFSSWYSRRFPGQRNDHGNWNGQNLLGINPAEVLTGQYLESGAFSLLKMLQGQRPLCRVLVRKTQFPWLRRYRALIRPNPLADREGVAGYELALNFNGIPFELVPRAASEIKGKSTFQLLWVDPAEHESNPARRLVKRKGEDWELASQGLRLLDLITY